MSKRNERYTYKYDTSVCWSNSAILPDCASTSPRFENLGPSKSRKSWSEAPQNTGSDGKGKQEATSEWIVLDKLMPRWLNAIAAEFPGKLIDWWTGESVTNAGRACMYCRIESVKMHKSNGELRGIRVSKAGEVVCRRRRRSWSPRGSDWEENLLRKKGKWRGKCVFGGSIFGVFEGIGFQVDLVL